MVNQWVRDRATHFYVGAGFAGLLVVALGFGVTYVVPMARQTFSAPWFVHVHGATALGWILLFIVQAWLVGANRTRLHRQLGQVGLPIALGVWASGIATALWAAKRDIAEQGAAATSALGGTVSGLSVFLLLVGAAVAARRTPDWHKRLVMLATIQVLWPAFFRLRHLLPGVPNPDISLALVLAYSPIVVAALRDRWRFGRIHPVWRWIGPVLVIEQSLEFAFFDRGVLRTFGQWIYGVLT